MDVLYQNFWLKVRKIFNLRNRHKNKKGEYVSKSNENRVSFGEILDKEIQKYKQKY